MLEELKNRYETFRNGCPRILVCSDSGVLPTGLARVVRGIFSELDKSKNFAIVQHGWSHPSTKTVEVPWPIVPVRREATDNHGQQSFDSIIDVIKPDLVVTIGDYQMFDHILDSQRRSSFQLVVYMPLDAFPPTSKWIEVSRKADKIVYYTEFAKSWASCMGISGNYIPHGVDTDVFVPLDEAARLSARKRLFSIEPTQDTILVGTVGRVQPRKRLPVFIETIAHVRAGGYSTCLSCDQISLHQYDPFNKSYISFSEMQTCPRCRKSGGWKHGQPWPNLKGYIHSDPREFRSIPIDTIAEYWNLKGNGSLLWNPSLKITQSQGIPESNLIEIYQCMDLYMHPACGGGCELPNLEAASSGVPIIAADAPAQNEYIAALEGSTLVPGDIEWDHTSIGYRVFTHVQDMSAALVRFLELSKQEKQALSDKNRQSALKFDWKAIVEDQWAPLFRELLDPSSRIEGWKVLQEV